MYNIKKHNSGFALFKNSRFLSRITLNQDNLSAISEMIDAANRFETIQNLITEQFQQIENDSNFESSYVELYNLIKP